MCNLIDVRTFFVLNRVFWWIFFQKVLNKRDACGRRGCIRGGRNKGKAEDAGKAFLLSALHETNFSYYPVTGVGTLDKIAPEYLAIFVTLSDVAH